MKISSKIITSADRTSLCLQINKKKIRFFIDTFKGCNIFMKGHFLFQIKRYDDDVYMIDV